jgi:subtilisin family serine protease
MVGVLTAGCFAFAPAGARAALGTAQWAERAGDPAALTTALRSHGDKLHADFEERLALAGPQGRLRVMVTTGRRTAAVEREMAGSTRWIRWYGRLPAFYASVTPDQVGALLRSPAVRLVEPDHELEHHMSLDARDIGVRGHDITPASTPSGDVVLSGTARSATWTGVAHGYGLLAAYVVPDLASPVARTCEAPTCHSTRLSLADPGDLTITTSGPDDQIEIEVIGPDGTGWRRSGNEDWPVVLRNAAVGTYAVRIWTNARAGVDAGDFTATATLADAPAQESIWRFEPGAGALGALRSADAALDADRATGKGVTVAVFDSGIDRTHPDFGGFDCAAAAAQPCESRVKKAVTLEGLADLPDEAGSSAPTTDGAVGHGTHVAGIVLGNGAMARQATGRDSHTRPPMGVPLGVAPQASLVSVKSGEGILAAGLAQFGFAWLIENAKALGIRAVNISWGCDDCEFDPESSMALALKALYDEGVLVVISAGNGGAGAFGDSAQSPYVLSVANYDALRHVVQEDSSTGERGAALSDPGTWTPEREPATGEGRPDLAAPGTNVWSTRSLTGGVASLVPRADTGDVPGAPVNEGTSGYTRMTGTSMSAPQVTGAAALLFSACPKATPLDAMRALMASADRDRVLATDGSRVAEPFEVGYGALDVPAALGWLRGHRADC